MMGSGTSITGTFLLLLLIPLCYAEALHASAAVGPPNGGGASRKSHNLRPFTVAESISMTHLDEPNEFSTDNPPVSPDGNHFLVVTEKGILDKNVREYSLLLYQIHKLGEEPIRLATFDSSSNGSGIAQAKWIDNRHISFIGENPGEVPQVYVVDIQTGDHEKMTSDSVGVIAYDVSQDRKKVAYYANWGGDEESNQYRENHGFAVSEESLADLVNGNWRRPLFTYQMYVKDAVTGKVQAVHAKPFRFNDRRLKIWLSPNGQYAITEQGPFTIPSAWESYEDKWTKLLAHEYQGKTYKLRPWGLTQTMIVDTETLEIRPLINAPSSVGSVVSVVWSADSHSVIVAGTLLPVDTTDPEELANRKAQDAIAEVDVLNGSPRRIINLPEHEECEIKPGRSPDTFVLGGWHMQHGELTTKAANRYFRRKGSEWVEDRDLEGDLGSNVVVRQSLIHWPELVKLDPATHREAVILDPNPQLKQVRFGREEVIQWTGKRGESQMGGLFYPTEYTPGIRYPLVIQTHGFATNLFLPDGPFTTAYAAQELANQGIVVLQLGRGPLYHRSQGTSDFGPVLMSQIESAVDYLDGLGLIDRDRVGLVGFSINGFQVTYTLAHSKYHFSVATSAEGNDYGYWSYVAGANLDSWAAQSEAPYGGPPWNGNWQPWLKESISFNYDKIHTPLRLEAEHNDVGVVINEWEPFIALKRLRKPVELVYVVHGEHPVVKPWDRITSQQGNVDWLLFWLKGEEDSDPSKAEQYARWHELKKLQDAEVAQCKATNQHKPSW
jgi:dipeptidyl aminopeptidase/acylaminoacyl peptidase